MLAVAIFVLAVVLALVEAPARSYPSRAEWRNEARTSFVLGAAALAIDMALPRPIAGGVETTFLLAALIFLADDFLYYVSHRLAHGVAFFWASHAVHHSPRRYNFLTGLRQPPTWILTPAAVAPLVLLSLGAPPVLVATSAGVRGVHHFLIHSEHVRRLPGWVEFAFNTPSHHRVHHGVSADCIDRNFGAVLIIWDRLFGTFSAEPEDGVRRYGLVHPTGAGAWRTMIDPWRSLLRRVAATQGTTRKLALMLAPPRR